MKYMLTIQHEEQKVSYTEFLADSDKLALSQAEIIFKNYQSQEFFMRKYPYISGNFTGRKPQIKNHHVSKWVNSETAVSAWGFFTGGYWKILKGQNVK